MGHEHRRQSRGAASVEAVVALPVFVVLFVGMFFLRSLTGARLAADQQVRRCSWEYAMTNNCKAAPVGCENVVGPGHYGSLVPDFDTAFNELGAGGTSIGMKDLAGGSASIGGKGLAKVQRIFQDFIVRYVSQAISIRFDATKGVEIQRPGLFGGGTTLASGKYGMACNVAPQGQMDVVQAVWAQFAP